jgi:hypothetical protein
MKGAGRVGMRCGRETRRHARVRTRRSTTSAGKADLTRLAHGAEREERVRGVTALRLATWTRKAERERESERAKETGADKPVPQGSERERERAREESVRADWRRQAGSAYQGRQARVGLGLVGWIGPKWLSLFPGFSNSFSISFSIGFSNPNSN